MKEKVVRLEEQLLEKELKRNVEAQPFLSDTSSKKEKEKDKLFIKSLSKKVEENEE